MVASSVRVITSDVASNFPTRADRAEVQRLFIILMLAAIMMGQSKDIGSIDWVAGIIASYCIFSLHLYVFARVCIAVRGYIDRLEDK